MRSCSSVTKAVAQCALGSTEFMDKVNSRVARLVVALSAPETAHGFALEFTRKLVQGRSWNLVITCLSGHDGHAWKRALFVVMREEHGLHVKQAVAFCEALSGRNCFITGAGGCGKSHLVNLLKEALPSVALLAPTRVAATRVLKLNKAAADSRLKLETLLVEAGTELHEVQNNAPEAHIVSRAAERRTN